MAPKYESSVSFSLGGTGSARALGRCLREALGTPLALWFWTYSAHPAPSGLKACVMDHHLEEQLEETLREGAGLTRAEQMLADALAEALRASRGGEGVPEGTVKGWRAGYLPCNGC